MARLVVVMTAWPNDCPLTQAAFMNLYPTLPAQALAARCVHSTQFVRRLGHEAQPNARRPSQQHIVPRQGPQAQDSF